MWSRLLQHQKKFEELFFVNVTLSSVCFIFILISIAFVIPVIIWGSFCPMANFHYHDPCGPPVNKIAKTYNHTRLFCVLWLLIWMHSISCGFTSSDTVYDNLQASTRDNLEEKWPTDYQRTEFLWDPWCLLWKASWYCQREEGWSWGYIHLWGRKFRK